MEYIQYIVIILSLLKRLLRFQSEEARIVIASLLIKFPALSKASKESTLFTHELRSWSGAVSEEEEALEPSFSFPGEALLLLTFLKVAMPFGRGSIFAWTFSSRPVADRSVGFVRG